jgi:hypothetical protein
VDSTRLSIDTSVWWPDAYIPALKPYGLERVPGFRLKDGAVIPAGWMPTPGETNPYEDAAWRGEHRDWRIALCDDARPYIHRKGNSNEKFADMERAQCAADPNYFGAVYGWIFDPKPKDDEPMRKPYAKFAYQCHNTTAQQRIIAEPFRSWLWRPKSRQLGISVDDEMFDTWFYLYGEGQAKLVSRNQLLVYNGQSYEAMLGKVRYNLAKLDEFTPYLLPAGYNIHKLLQAPHFRDLVLTNPITGTALIGESTTKEVGRGGTYTYARVDETGFVDNLEQSLTSLSEAALHLLLASTEHATEYLEIWQAAKREKPDSVMEFNWHQNAYLDTAWEREAIANALSKVQQEGLWREAFRDPFAGFGVWVYPEARDLPDRDQPYRPDEPLDTTIDAAGAGDDMALMACQATAIDGNEGFHVLFGYERQMPNPEWLAHVITGIWPERGDACFGMQPDVEEQELGRFYYDAWLHGRELRWFMDPAADQVHSKVSYWTMLRDKTGELRQREYERLLGLNIALEEAGKLPAVLPVPKPIAPKFEIIKKHRLFGDREFALRKYLPFVTFQTGVKSAARIRECWGRTRYNDLADRAVTAPKRRHDQYSHQASNGEHYAIYYSYRFVDPLDSKAMRKLQKGLGLRGVPSGFGKSAVPKGFGQNRGLPPSFGDRRPAPPGTRDRVAPGGWR